MAGQDNYYVVFKGRNTGIFKDWITCHAQITRYNGRLYQGFHTIEEAKTAWVKFCKDENISEPIEEVKESQQWNVGASSSEEVSFEGHSMDVESVCGDETHGHQSQQKQEDIVVEVSKQDLLRHVCQNLGLQAPSWSRYDSKERNGVSFYKYTVSVACGYPGKPIVMFSKYCASHEDACESVSFKMLQFVLRMHGKKVKDYNYHFLKDMDALLKHKDDQIACMLNEIEVMAEENKTLKTCLGIPR